MQPLPSYMVRSTGKTYREIDILMVDSPEPLPGLAKFRIWRSSCIVLVSKLRRRVRKTTILNKTIDKSYAQRHTPGSRDNKKCHHLGIAKKGNIFIHPPENTYSDYFDLALGFSWIIWTIHYIFPPKLAKPNVYGWVT